MKGRARPYVIAVTSSTAGAFATSTAMTGGPWWPAGLLLAAWVCALLRLRWLDRNIRRLDAEIAAESVPNRKKAT